MENLLQAQGGNTEQFRPAGRDGQVQLRGVQTDGQYTQQREQAEESHGHGQQQLGRLQHVHQVEQTFYVFVEVCITGPYGLRLINHKKNF